ncbi:MAG: hypothetical protein IT207_11235 [Fimbriimonadaceae bacterium]|nr:hypothetical protein [Fimbriimonadaceae bacterium]
MKRVRNVLIATLGAAATVSVVAAQDKFAGFVDVGSNFRFEEVVRRCADMVSASDAQRYVQRSGLNLMNLTWEDTGRYKGSSVGPNISDMTIQVRVAGGRSPRTYLMPVIRHPNFSDLTGDVDPRSLGILVGNEHGEPLKRVSLTAFLADPGRYMSDPASWKGRPRSLLAERDSKVLVSAQACFLPVPGGEKAEFNPVLFNYQSQPGDPAVLTILATREGTSMTVIDNQRDTVDTGWNWGQRLFFNDDGKRASLTGERLSDYKARGGDPIREGGVAVPEAQLNMVMLIQVPLKQRSTFRYSAATPAAEAADAASAKMKGGAGGRANENAVIGHGEWEGPFVEMAGNEIERDPRFPIRVTVQFYKATETGQVSPGEVAQIKKDIDLVYASASAVGSLVTGGRTGRVTEYDGIKVQPAEWWSDFWGRYELYSGTQRDVAVNRLRKLIGTNYMDRPVCELYLRDLLRP